MPLGRSPRLTDPDDLRFRVQSVRIGLLCTLALCLAAAVHYAASPEAPNRTVLGVMCAALTLAALLLLPVRWTAVVQGRWRDTFFTAWSGGTIIFVAVAYYLEGAGGVSLGFAFALPLAFAGLVYPLRGAVAAAAFVVASYLAASLARPYEWDDLIFATAALGGLAAICVWTAWWQARLRDVLARLSRTDPLTGCLNRRGLEDRVQRALLAGGAFALVTLDLDDFKTTNDRDGHAAGDAVLCAAVRALQEAVRPTDSVGRVGGDEFAIVLPGATRDVAARVMERATLALSVAAPASFGVASFPQDGETLEGLFRHADIAVYRAKAARRGRSYGAATEAPAPALPSPPRRAR